MDFTDVQNQLSDLPLTFRRFGPVFAGLIQSLTAAIARTTIPEDQLAGQTNLQVAKWGWLDAIGKLYGIQRNQYETDPQYRARLFGTLTAWHGTPQAIVNFIQLALNINTSISENFSLASYQINFNSPPSTQTLTQVAIAINWVRPAGIPFLPLFSINGGLYVNTLNYLGAKQVTGSYFSRPGASITINLAPNTDNPKPIYLQLT